MKYEFDKVAFRCPYCKSGFQSCPTIPNQASYRQTIEYACGTIIEYVKDKGYLVAAESDNHRSIQCRMIEETIREDDDQI